MSSPILNIILVNFNGTNDTIDCLQSIFSAKAVDSFVRIFVIDNSTVESEFIKLKNWCYRNLNSNFSFKDGRAVVLEENDFDSKIALPEYFYLIKANKNNGFAAANNIVLRKVDLLGDSWAWLLNNDTIVSYNVFLELNDRLAGNGGKKVGMLGTPLYYYHDRDRLQGIGGSYNKWLGVSNHLGAGMNRDELSQNIDNLLPKVDYIIGASLIINANLVKDIGVLSESYFLYFEELDFFERAKRAGWSFNIFFNVEILHKEGASINKNIGLKKSELAEICSFNSRLVFARKFYKNYLPFIYLFIFLAIFKRALKGQIGRVKILLKVIFSNRFFIDYINSR